MLTANEKIIPKGDTSEEIPIGLHIKYMAFAFGGEKEITEDSLNQLIEKINNIKNLGIYLSQTPDLDGDYMQIEIDGNWIALQYVEIDSASFYSSFDPAYLNSEEESPINCSDGQSIIQMRYTMHDPKLAAKCVEYFVRTGKLYPGMEWLKSWTD